MHPSRGFAIVEAIVATGLTIVAVATVAQLVSAAVAVNRRARTITIAVVLARDKMEELVATLPLQKALAPAGSVADDVAGYLDAADASGRAVSGPSSPDAAYVRRWSIVPLAARPSIVALQVSVTDRRGVEPAVRLTTLRGAVRF